MASLCSARANSEIEVATLRIGIVGAVWLASLGLHEGVSYAQEAAAPASASASAPPAPSAPPASSASASAPAPPAPSAAPSASPAPSAAPGPVSATVVKADIVQARVIQTDEVKPLPHDPNRTPYEVNAII